MSKFEQIYMGQAEPYIPGMPHPDAFIRINENYNITDKLRGAAEVTHTKTTIVAGDLEKLTVVDDTGGAVNLDISSGIGTYSADKDMSWFALQRKGDENDITVTHSSGTIKGDAVIKTMGNILFVYKSGANEWTCVGGEA